MQPGKTLAATTLDLIPLPCWVVRADLAVEFGNVAAQEATRTKAWVRRSNGHLVALADLGVLALADLVCHAAHGAARCASLGLQDEAQGAMRPGVLQVVPLRQSPLFAQTWPQAAAMLLVVDPTPPCDDWITSHLAPHLSLTDREGQVLALLVDGWSPAGIAKRFGVEAVTVRTHLRSLREKTGRRSIAGLVRLGLGS